VRRLAALVAATSAIVAVAAGAARAPTVVVRGDVQIGRFLVQRDGSLGGAVRAFGRPSILRRTRNATCTARWRAIGLRIVFYNLGGFDPCSRRHGRFSVATMVGRRWTTGKRLRIGEPARRLRALYGKRRRSGSWIWLLTRRSPVGAGETYPGLAAKVHRGRVTAFRVRYPAGGD
jgi:hypothetical protein